MIRKPSLWLACAVLTLVVTPSGPQAWGDNAAPRREKATGKNDTRIADLAWIAGHWSRRDGRDRLEEIWSTPDGNCMMGVFRWVKGGKVWIYEMLTIAEEEEGIVFRFRHFSKDLDAWEPKDAPLCFTLSSHDGQRAIFENVRASSSMRRYIFKRNGDRKLTIRIDGGSDTDDSADVFEFSREPRQPVEKLDD